MFIGHAAVALAAKPLAPRVNLALLLAAAFWVDMVWPVLLLAGIEEMKIDPGNTAFTPLEHVRLRARDEVATRRPKWCRISESNG